MRRGYQFESLLPPMEPITYPKKKNLLKILLSNMCCQVCVFCQVGMQCMCQSFVA
jgi:hypothetical protein